MMMSDLLLLSTRAFTTRPMRTFLTILGVGVGIGTVLFLVSLGYGLQNTILSQITSADALLTIDVTPGSSAAIALDQDSLSKFSQMQNVAEVSPVVTLNSQFSIGELTGDGLVYAVSPSYFRLSGMTTQLGELFKDTDTNSIIISSAGAELFNLEPAKILNKEIALTLLTTEKNDEGFEEVKAVKRENKYVVKGVIEDDSSSFVFIPMQSVSDLKIDKFSAIKVKVKDEKFMENSRNQIIDMGFLASALSDTIDQAKKIFKIIQIILALFGLVALIVSAIGMFNTMTVTLLERINEIGIMRSIGASKGDIKKIFLIESVLMGLLGGVFGIILGYLGGEVANFGINLLAKNFGGQSLSLFYIPAWFVGFILVFSTVIGFLTGVFPSMRASRLNPLDALRYK